MSRVCVLADSTVEGEGRTCFWGALADELPGITLDVGSLPEDRAAHRFLDFRKYDCIVFNWDVLNLDVWFQGDISWLMAERAGSRFLPNWVKGGGLIIVEAQASNWAPEQRAYDLMCPGVRVRQYSYVQARIGTAFHVVKRNAEHPFTKNLDPDCDYSFDGTQSERRWFPEWYLTAQAPSIHHDPRRTHSGTFVSHTATWLPLLECSSTSQPVMLAASSGRGAIVATTMYLASSGQVDLIRGLVGDWLRLDDTTTKRDLRAYHAKKRRRIRNWLRYDSLRRAPRWVVAGILLVVGVVYFNVFTGLTGSFLGFLVFSVLGARYYDDIVGLVKLAKGWVARQLGSDS